MTVIEELMATVRAQQHTIEVLTIKLEETNAKLDKANAKIAELEDQLHNDSRWFSTEIAQKSCCAL